MNHHRLNQRARFQAMKSLRYVTTFDKIRNKDENKCRYDKRKKGTTEKQSTSRLVTKADSSILGFYSLLNPEECSSSKRLVI
jgi:hypothetical protein